VDGGLHLQICLRFYASTENGYMTKELLEKHRETVY